MQEKLSTEQELDSIAEIVINNRKGRKVVLWGDNKYLRELLKNKYDVDIEFIVSVSDKYINGTTVKPLEVISGKKDTYYLVAWGANREERYIRLLSRYGFMETEDYVYRRIAPIVIENVSVTSDGYHDIYGNEIICGDNIYIKKVVFRGFNNHITIGKNVNGLKNISFDMHANHEVIISDGCSFNGDNLFKMYGYEGTSKIYIGKNCRFLRNTFLLYNDTNTSDICINDNCTFEENTEFHANSGKKIIIGNDCMFSHDVLLQSGDGHSIFDVVSEENINSVYENQSTVKNCIYVGRHVWVGTGALLLHGTSIKTGSIVAAKSCVKGIFDNNCVIAGNPAKIVKKDIAWSRDNSSHDINSCGKNNISLTNSSAAPLHGKSVLVIGGTRFMGVQLVRALLENGNDVTIATRGNVKNRFGSRVKHIYIDLDNPDTIKNALNNKYYDVVFDNLAYCSAYVEDILNVVKCGRYIQLSSVEVYSPTKIDLRESDFNPYKYPAKRCSKSVGYVEGKRQAEAVVYQKFPKVPAVTVRVPYVTDTDRLLYYTDSIVNQIPMNIDDVERGFTFVQDYEVGEYLTWIAAQDKFTGPVNLASVGHVTIAGIINYIERKTGKTAIIDTVEGKESPFHVYNEKSFTMNMDKSVLMGYKATNIDDWFWKLLDKYIARSVSENKKSANTVNIIKKENCTGCGACMNICPKGAISMIVDSEGYEFPVIDYGKCIECGACLKVCPTINCEANKKHNKVCYALMASDELREVSSSGGAFTLFAEEIIDRGGVVFGAAWQSDYGINHIMIDNKDELNRLRGSKYAQSSTCFTYQDVKKYLLKNVDVLYTGTPCQIDGLLHFLGKDYPNLYTVDLLCRGMASDELFKRFVRENYNGRTLKDISFKAKKPLGWGATTSYTFENGETEKTNIHNSIWMCAYLANIMDRKSCYTCNYASPDRVGDISIGDFWGIEKHNKDYNDKKGTSIVITTTEKGNKLVESVKDKCILLEQVPIEKGIPYNSALSSHVKPTPKREVLYENLKKMPFPAAFDRAFYGKKYDVGIVGWWYNLNYGGTLTYYSLYKALEKMGYSVLMIRRSSSSPNMPNDNTVPMRFAKKKYNISRLYTAHDMHWLNYSCRSFISGSDQLWNPYLEQYSGPEYFLSFVNEYNTKISYASSFGNISSINEDFVKRYKKYIDRFDGISVREDYGVELCERDFQKETVHVCDPIFLNDADTFRDAAKDSKLELPEKYLLNFLLDPDNDKVEAYRNLQKQLGLNSYANFTDLQNIEERIASYGGDKVYGNAEIEDFIKAYEKAEFIFTDSFHGTCMAIIFNKPFISIANKQRGEKRFISLLKWLGLENRLVFDLSEITERKIYEKPINYDDVNEIIDKSKKSGIEWLRKLIN